MKSRFLLAGAAIALLAAPFAASQGLAQAGAAATTAAKAAIGTWGVDLSGRDTSVKPGDDFNLYAGGKWAAATSIPEDRTAVGPANELSERNQEQAQQLITSAPAGSKYGALYASYLDEAQIEKVGLAPLLADLAKLKSIKTKSQFARLMGEMNGKFGSSVVDFGVIPDTADPTINVLFLSQGGLGLPDRTYYLDDSFKKQRDAYRAFIERTMKFVGHPDPVAAATTIMNFETNVAIKSWDADASRDLTKINNPMTTAQLARYAPGIDWKAFWQGARIPAQKRMIVAQNTGIRGIAAIYGETALDTLKLWQTFQIASQASPYLTKAMVDSQFEFTRQLTGVTQMRPRWRRALRMVDGALGELVGQDYVARFFPESSKSKMDVLVAGLKTAMAGRIRSNDWMSDATKTAALDKLARMDVMVGYPDKWRDYSGLAVDAKDLYGNAKRSGAFNAAYAMSFLGKKVDRKLWAMNPQTVNAYNSLLENKIVFPAGILQAPFFDPAADDAVNYGAIGAVIGHEISHGFDDQGRKVDATGAVRDWWTPEDAKRFDQQAGMLGAQYAKYEAAPGMFVNPKLTMGENIADLAGVQIALDAYHASLGGKEAPVIDGLTGDQRFFLAFAQVWRTKMRDDALRNQVATDPHSPAEFRTYGPLRNVDGWYSAFSVQPGDKLYIAPDQRARIW